jgi:hypothetical protein
LKSDSSHKFGFGGPGEADEVYIGPNPAKMHKSRKASVQARDGLKGGYVGKTAVHGMLDRELRQVRARVMPNVKRETLQNAILNNVTPMAKVYPIDGTGSRLTLSADGDAASALLRGPLWFVVLCSWFFLFRRLRSAKEPLHRVFKVLSRPCTFLILRLH